MQKNFTPFIVPLFLLFCASQIWAQPEGHAFQHLEANQTRTKITNDGWQFQGVQQRGGLEIPAGSQIHAATGMSLWIGGYDINSQLHVSGDPYPRAESAFEHGPYRNSGVFTYPFQFESPSVGIDRQLIALASGKVLITYPYGFSVFNPADGTQIDRSTGRLLFEIVELPDGRLLLFGDAAFPTQLNAMIIDTTNFNSTSIGALAQFHRYSSATRLLNGQVLLAGPAGCEIFDPVSNSSVAVAPMLNPKADFPTVLLPNGNVLCVGGGTGLGATGASIQTQIYNPASNTWTYGPSLSTARKASRITLMPSGTYLISGGVAGSNPTFDVYDPLSNTISQLTGAPRAMDLHCAIPLPSGEILFSKTWDIYSWNITDPLCYKFNPTTQTYRELPIFETMTKGVMLPSGNVFMEFADKRYLEVDPVTEKIAGQRWQKVWKLSRGEVDQFRMDWQNNQVNFANYPDVETWPAHGDTAAGEDFHLAPFEDVNQDGRYRPLQDGDYPCFEGDMATWHVFNDDSVPGPQVGDHLGIQVEVLSYQYDCAPPSCPDSALNYTNFFHYEITNQSDNDYTDVYLGLNLLSEIGNYEDDVIGYDTVLGMGYAYNYDTFDETFLNHNGYGSAPPALGAVFLDNGQLGKPTNMMALENSQTSVTGYPENQLQFYDYMRSRWKDGTHMVDNFSDGYAGSAPGPNANFMFPGDPGNCSGPGGGWIAPGSTSWTPGVSLVQSIGPMDLLAGETVKLDVALVWARGNTNRNSVCRLKTAAAAIKSWWENKSRDCFDITIDRDPPLADAGSFTLAPNPSPGRFQIHLEQAYLAGGTLRVFDLSGRVFLRETIAPGLRSVQVDRTDLPDGVYLVQVELAEEVSTRKLVVQH